MPTSAPRASRAAAGASREAVRDRSEMGQFDSRTNQSTSLRSKD